MHPKFDNVLKAVDNANRYARASDKFAFAMEPTKESNALYHGKILLALANTSDARVGEPLSLDALLGSPDTFPARLLHISYNDKDDHPYQLWFQEGADEQHIARISMTESNVLAGHLAGLIYTFLWEGKYPGKPELPH